MHTSICVSVYVKRPTKMSIMFSLIFQKMTHHFLLHGYFGPLTLKNIWGPVDPWGLNEIFVWFLLPTYPNFFNPTLNLKIVFGEKIPKMGTFSIFVTISLLNVITKFNNFPTYLP